MISLLKLSMVSYTTGVDSMAYTIVYLAFSLTMLYAGYKYQKDSEFVFSIFGGKSVVSILEILLSIMFLLSAILEIAGYSNNSFFFKFTCKFMAFFVAPIFIIDTTYYRIKKKKKD